MRYLVRVTVTYPVCAVDAVDALSTVPMAVRIILPTAEGLTEILDATTKEVVLKAQLNLDPPSPSSNEKNTLYIL